MNAIEKANKVVRLIAYLAVVFVFVIYVPRFFGFNIPTTLPVNFTIFLLLLFAIIGISRATDGKGSIVLLLSGFVRWFGGLALLIIVTAYLIGWGLPHREWFYALAYLGFNGVVLREYMKKIDF